MEEFVKEIKGSYDIFRQRVMDECIVTRQTFYAWSHGEPMLEKYKPIINRIALEIYGRKVFDE